MITKEQAERTRIELNRNLEALGFPRKKVMDETEMTPDEFEQVLTMKGPYPGDVWKLREYLGDKLEEEGIEGVPFTGLDDPRKNKWYPYETPWRNK